MPTVTNAGAQPIKWTLRRASTEFGVSVPTLVGKLNEVGETADENKTFSTRAIVAALYGDAYRERLAKLRAEREHTQLETAILRGDYVARLELERVFTEIAGAMKQIVRASKLDRGEQEDFLRSLAAIPTIKTVANHQRNGRDGDISGRTRSKKKAKSTPRAPARAK